MIGRTVPHLDVSATSAPQPASPRPHCHGFEIIKFNAIRASDDFRHAFVRFNGAISPWILTSNRRQEGRRRFRQPRERQKAPAQQMQAGNLLVENGSTAQSFPFGRSSTLQPKIAVRPEVTERAAVGDASEAIQGLLRYC